MCCVYRMNRPAAGLTVVFCGRWSGKPGPKSAAWRMPWQKSGNDDVGGVNPRLFPAGPRTEHKGSRRRLRFTRPCRAWPCGFSVMWPQRRVRAVRFRGLTLQLPPAVCVRLRLPLRPVHPRLIARLLWRHGTARCRGICEQRRKTSCNMRNLSL
ncbi:DUF1472 domain-containing protein [Escherichia coli]|nr:DUF1472 domain-containing protein [Escherichia coli]